MANLDTLEEWHLTPEGWRKNTLKSRNRDKKKDIGVPADRYLTIQCWEYERSNWSALTGGCDYSFISNDKKTLGKLIQSYGNAPKRYFSKFKNRDPLNLRS